MSFTSRHGWLVARALNGSWRMNPGLCDLNQAQIDEIAPILLRSGAAPLVWRRLDRTGLEPREDFFQAYKQQTLQAAVHEDDVARVFRSLQEAQLDAMVVKGWAIARMYPDQGLRHYGDLDLCVRTNQFTQAKTLLEREVTKEIWIDLHQGTAALDYAPETEIFERSVVVSVDAVSVRIPSPEDHLRILCFHLLRHGAWRPLWLCDVALALESRPTNFNWAIFLGDDAKRADWLACVLGLAHQLLGAAIADTPVAARANQLPEWLTRAVLRRWGRWFNSDYRDEALPSFAAHKSNLPRLLEDIYFRCDPIRATVETNAKFSNSSRLPYQLLALLRGTSQVVSRVISKG